MNPSSSGWILKFESEVQPHQDRYKTFAALYSELKHTGFVYGINASVLDFITVEHTLAEDEKAKLNLFTGLYFTHRIERQTGFMAFLEDLSSFYKHLHVSQLTFLDKLLSGRTPSAKVEKLIDSRVYLEDNLLSKTFKNVITNSLLCLDVLLFKRYLTASVAIKVYAYNLEYLAIQVTYHALHSKQKNKNDEKLEQLFAASLSFINPEKQAFDGSYRDMLLRQRPVYENTYLLDIACLTVWEDHSLDSKESEFMLNTGKDVGFDSTVVNQALDDVQQFIKKNEKTVSFLKDDNMAVQFYDSMTKVVNKLILRNSKRLQKELAESAELVALLTKSTVRDLTQEEKKKVQNQLLDIFKSIPSLAIFILPGGAVLLPLFIKLIPKLLPSSFDENRVDNKKSK